MPCLRPTRPNSHVMPCVNRFTPGGKVTYTYTHTHITHASNQLTHHSIQVFGFTLFGAYASHVVVPEGYCRPLPQGWTYEQGASFVVRVYLYLPIDVIEIGYNSRRLSFRSRRFK